ncbi:hypothetical protein ACGFNU_24500 [Spirillospora sp. NPDC048911]|uniref:hypothetical protein n=1 Tax=Spirillospora sp. NPDC048911 TaxID=3364527 RepID=UPI0037138124
MDDEKSGPRQPARDRNTARATDREREARYANTLKFLGEELAELVDLRGRIARAKAVLGRGGDRQDAIDALDGRVR